MREHRVGGGFAGSVVRVALYATISVTITLGALAILPGIPSQYNILAPLDPAAPASPLSRMKVARATATPEKCLAVLGALPDLGYSRLADREESEVCHIRGHVQVRALSGASIPAVSTSCATALRLYLWERHSLQTAAQTHLGARVARIGHRSSYNCRPIRTEAGEGEVMSAHATASAIDIASVTLTDGRRFDLLTGWGNADPNVRRFWRAARSGACDWFGTVLGPEYNRLHADHFHFGQDRWGACK